MGVAAGGQRAFSELRRLLVSEMESGDKEKAKGEKRKVKAKNDRKRSEQN
jgi:hypothetical protein